MRFYRVRLYTDGGVSAGMEWFTSMHAAKAAKCKAMGNDPGEIHDPEIDSVDVVPTKAGILNALNTWAAHPDNG